MPSAPSASNSDPLSLIDARIRLAIGRRASCERFSEAYWQADDDLAWLRMVRDEVARTGHLRAELAAMLTTSPAAVEMEPDAALTLPMAVPKPPAPRVLGAVAAVEADDTRMVAGAA